ncbi:MAG: fibrobacter succinogenes major paralogous domain-containing protein [Panacibacter sp.]
MKTTTKTGLAVVLLLAISCKKENNILQSSRTADNNPTSDVITVTTAKYPSVQIGSQKWMAKNLDVSRYRNGDKIPHVKNPATWAALTTGAWCYYNNDSANGAIYGKLYNWYAVNDPRGLAPNSYHIPSDAEWTTLTTFLGGDLVAGGKMKETGTTHWAAPNTDATNSSGFTALPGGFRYYADNGNDGAFYGIGTSSSWWSSTGYAWYRYLVYNNGSVFRYSDYLRVGYSVRCIKD